MTKPSQLAPTTGWPNDHVCNHGVVLSDLQGESAVSYVSPNTVSVSQRRNNSLSMNCLKSSVSSLSTAVITRVSALSSSMQAFCLSEFFWAFW